MSDRRIKELDIARALSMVIILLHHAPNYTNYFNGTPAWTVIDYVARWALGSFVMCSGFLLGSRHALNTWMDIRTFYAKRILRIVPLFALSLFTWHPSHPIGVSLAALTGTINFMGIPNVFTLWFVSMLVVFYALCPLLCRQNRLTQITVAVLIEGALWLGAENLGWEPRLWLYFPCFAVGAIASRQSKEIQIGLVGLGTIIALLLWALWPKPEGFASTIRPLFGSGAIIAISWLLNKIKLIEKPFSILAYSSMAAYLFHRQIFIFFRGILGFPADGPLRGAEILIVCIPTVLFAGFIIQKGYDVALGKILKRYGTPKTH